MLTKLFKLRGRDIKREGGELTGWDYCLGVDTIRLVL